MKDDTPDESRDHPHQIGLHRFRGYQRINNWADVSQMPLGAMGIRVHRFGVGSGPRSSRVRNVQTGPGEGAMLDEVQEIVLLPPRRATGSLSIGCRLRPAKT